MKKFVCVLLVVIAAAAFFDTKSMSSHITKKTLKRKSDPVIVRGAQLEKLLGVPPEKIRVFAAGPDGKLETIPFQIDERDPKGELVFPFGPKRSSDPDPNFDPNDELVFMAKDTGPQAPRETWPKNADAGVEIEITDPLDGGRGWVYAMSFAAPPQKSRVDYVSISKDGMKITTPRYETAFCREAPIAFGSIALTKEGGGDGLNYIDRLKIRATAVPRMINIPIKKSENDFSSELVAYIDGPVRVIRRTNNKMYLFWKIPTPGSIVDNVYYYDQFVFPTEVYVPFDLGALLQDMRFRVTTDHNKRAKGMRFVNSNNPNGADIDGKMTPEERKLNLDPYSWMVIHGTKPGRRGGWLNRIEFDKEIKAQPYLYYMDDEKAADPPESDPGQIGNIGYDIRYMETLKKGVWRLTSYMYNVTDYQPGAEKEYLDVLDHPLTVTVR
jgi:hypothetical protein